MFGRSQMSTWLACGGQVFGELAEARGVLAEPTARSDVPTVVRTAPDHLVGDAEPIHRLHRHVLPLLFGRRLRRGYAELGRDNGSCT